MTPEQKLERHRDWLEEKIQFHSELYEQSATQAKHHKSKEFAFRDALTQLNEGGDEK